MVGEEREGLTPHSDDFPSYTLKKMLLNSGQRKGLSQKYESTVSVKPGMVMNTSSTTRVVKLLTERSQPREEADEDKVGESDVAEVECLEGDWYEQEEDFCTEYYCCCC